MENSFTVVTSAELTKKFGKDDFELLIVSNSDENVSLFFRRALMDDTKAGVEMKNSNDPVEVAPQEFEIFHGW